MPFQRKNGHISQTVRDTAKVKPTYALSDEMKIIDLGWPSRSVTTSTADYPSDS